MLKILLINVEQNALQKIYKYFFSEDTIIRFTLKNVFFFRAHLFVCYDKQMYNNKFKFYFQIDL